MTKFRAISEDEAIDFVSKVHQSHELIKEFNRLNNDSAKDSQQRRRQIEIELNNIDNWFNGTK